MPAPRAPAQDAALSLEQLAVALARKGIPLPFEIGTFLVLESCERLIGAPLLVSARDIYLSDEGEVAIAATLRASSDVAAARALLIVLGELLVRSAPGVPPMLLDLCEHGASDDTLGLSALRDQLEAALVPLNRAATRRVLSRLLREIRRERERGPAVPAPDAERLDAELDALLGVPEPSRPQPVESTAHKPAAPKAHAPVRRELPDDEAEIEEPAEDFDTLRMDEGPPAASRLSARKARAPRVARSEPGESTEHDLDAPAGARRDRALDAFASVDADRERSARRGLWLGLVLIALAAIVLGAYAWLGQDGARRLVGLAPMQASPPAAAAPAAPQPPPVKYGELRVTSVPEGAQVLLWLGRAPALARGLPLGVAHELVALLDGRAPARKVVAPDAVFQQTEAGASLGLSIELPELPRGSSPELGPTQLPKEMGTPTGALGTVRIESTPQGASIYQLIGFTPEARVENLKTSEPIELLVYLSGHELARSQVTEQSFVEREGRLVADVHVQLSPLAAAARP